MRSVEQLGLNEEKLSVLKEIAQPVKLSFKLQDCGISLYHLEKEGREVYKDILGEPLQSTDYLIIQSNTPNQIFFVDCITDVLEELNNCTYACFCFSPENGVISFMEDYLDEKGKLKL